jgi:hypothetical protein
MGRGHRACPRADPRRPRRHRGRVTYEQALSDYFADLLRAHRGDPSPIWSIDDVHADYILSAVKKFN